MRLNRYHKQAFVDAVIQDVPTVDYDAQAQTLVRDAYFQEMPPEVKVVYENKEMRGWLAMNHVYMPRDLNSFYTYHRGLSSVPPREIEERLEELAQLKHDQKAKMQALRQKLDGLINSVSTLKQALERMPEFEKYLPKETENTGVSNLPAIHNTVAELVLMGWPKDQEKAA